MNSQAREYVFLLFLWVAVAAERMARPHERGPWRQFGALPAQWNVAVAPQTVARVLWAENHDCLVSRLISETQG